MKIKINDVEYDAVGFVLQFDSIEKAINERNRICDEKDSAEFTGMVPNANGERKFNLFFTDFNLKT